MTDLKKSFDAIFQSLSDLEMHDQGLHDLIRVRCADRSDLQTRLHAEFFGHGPLEDLLNEGTVTEIMINAFDEIWIERTEQQQSHKYKWDDSFLSDWSYRRWIERLCSQSGKSLDHRDPQTAGQWKNLRFQIAAPPLSPLNPIVCLRRHRPQRWTLHELQQQDWCNEFVMHKLRECLYQKKNLIVSGITGSGKTSVVSALLAELPSHERILVVEDTDEIVLPNSLSVKLLTREDNELGLKPYSINDLVRMGLRLRPDRILVGEVRGAEAKDWLLALSTGHSGGITTIHADQPHTALKRLELLVQMAQPEWSVTTIRELIFQNIYGVVQLEKTETGHRRLQSFHRLHSLETHHILLESILERPNNVRTEVDLNPLPFLERSWLKHRSAEEHRHPEPA